MGLFNAHSRAAADAFLRPSFGLANQLARFWWQITWTVLCRFTPNPLHRWRCLVLGAFGARLGRSNFVYPNAKIWAPWLLETGDVVTIGAGAIIYNPGGAFLDHHTIVSEDAYLCGASHNYNSPEFTYLAQPIRTGAYVWICARAIVLPGVSCCEGSVLGAGAVTARDLDAWTVYAGNPANAIRKRTLLLDGLPVADSLSGAEQAPARS
ncbi:MAG: hypothetical protein L0Z50_28270 [Verrucomicrobiales bacterium]|nr:hypothetical protein [Verrucomicrobiales bacterium]